MNKLGTLIKKELFEQLRTSKLIIIAFLLLFVAISSPIFAKLLPEILKNTPATPGLTINLPEPTVKDAIDQFIKNISQLGVFVLIFVVAGAIADEKAKKTLEILLTKPIQRSHFVISKFLSYFLSIGAIYFISSIIFYTYTVSIFGAFSAAHFVIMAAAIFLYILLIVSVTLCGSAFTRTTVAAAGIGFVGMIVFSTVTSAIKSVSRFSPDFITRHYSDIMNSGWDSKFLPSIITTVILIIIFILISVFSFKNQEVER